MSNDTDRIRRTVRFPKPVMDSLRESARFAGMDVQSYIMYLLIKDSTQTKTYDRKQLNLNYEGDDLIRRTVRFPIPLMNMARSKVDAIGLPDVQSYILCLIVTDDTDIERTKCVGAGHEEYKQPS